MDNHIRRRLYRFLHEPIHPGALLERNLSETQGIAERDRIGWLMGFADALALSNAFPTAAMLIRRYVNDALASTCDTPVNAIEQDDEQTARELAAMFDRWRPYLDLVDHTLELTSAGPPAAGD